MSGPAGAVALALEAPEGAVLEFAVVFTVVLLGPLAVERARIPGIIGLLLGGFAVGPHGLGWIEAGNETVPELGQLGLLYLMFGAGLELDLALLSRYRRAAVAFGVLTFAAPFAAGVAVGVTQGWEAPASLLLGSLLASHTLILYPTVRDAGRGGVPAVAAAVGATVLTDTLALAVLAGVAGTATGSGSTAAVLAQVAVGLVVLAVAGLVALPRLAVAALERWGGDRAARYLVAVVAFLLMAVLAEVFGIEGIVGAFVAGLALNRVVPHAGPSMERIEFFGSAVLVPVFLVSVGLLLDPSVMASGETLGIAALLCVACLGGKAAAAALARPLLGFGPAEAGLMFVLTTPQAAATLAATLVGYDIGLFGTAVVNAVLVLILVSILVSTLAAPRFLARCPVPADDHGGIGRRVLLATGPDGVSPAAAWVARRLTAADGGTVDVIVLHDGTGPAPDDRRLRTIGDRLFRGRLDGTVRALGGDAATALHHAALGTAPSAVLVDHPADLALASWQDLPDHMRSVAVIAVHGGATPDRRPVVVSGPTADRHAGRVVAALAGRRRAAAPPDDAASPDDAAAVVVHEAATWAAVTPGGRPADLDRLHVTVLTP